MRGLIMAALLTAGLTAPVSATVRSGIEAWQNGDPAKAVSIWRALADKGDQDAAFNLGQAYRLGRGVPADSGQAKKWFERAAKAGHLDAQVSLGRGVPADSGQAKKWFLAAAKAGHLDAQVSLGLLLFDIGDRATALNWLKRAADRGEPRALLVTGTALFNGDGLPRDPVRGYAYVSRAAAQGLAPAKTTLADMDKVMPLADRQKGVALALSAAAASPASPKPAIAKPASAKPSTVTPKVSITTAKPLPPLPVATGGGWKIQLGAFGTRGAAQALFDKLAPKLGAASAYYVPVGSVTRLQAGPFLSRAAASEACARLKPQPCFPVGAK